MNLRQKALEFATKAHEGQFRKDGKTPYIEHPKAVAVIAVELFYKHYRDYFHGGADMVYAIAVNHDVLEDTDVTFSDLVSEFGEPIAKGIDRLSKKEGENYLDLILRAKEDYMTRIVKISDNIHNMSDLREGTLKDKYRLSKYILEH